MTHATKRFLEILPGTLVWTTLILSVLFSFVRPLWMVYFVMVFDLYWLFRIVYNLPFLVISWARYRSALRRNWQKDAEALPGYADVHHLIFLPMSKEDEIVAMDTLEILSRSTYPASRMMIVLAGEARCGVERFEQIAKTAEERFGSRFFRFFWTIHPADQVGDIIGKGSNLHWAAEHVVPRVLALGLDPKNVIVSSFDIDTIVHPQYFSCLTYKYLTEPDPTRTSYQPVPLYNNNLWQSPAPVRVSMFGTTFWLMMEQAHPEGMMTFSSHSMSLQMLLDVGYWQRDVVSEDSRIFLQGFIHYDGAYRVTPIHLPVSMDTVMAGDYWKALIALYKQQRRWAWGVENFPYMVEQFAAHPKMSLWTKIAWIFKQLEGSYTWATAAFLIFLLGHLPFLVAPEQFRSFAIFQNTPFTLEWLMRFSMVGLFVSATLALTLLPPRPRELRHVNAYGIMLLQWILLPVTFIVFGAIPALDAQTRLMFGKRLGFFVSPKRNTSVSSPPTP